MDSTKADKEKSDAKNHSYEEKTMFITPFVLPAKTKQCQYTLMIQCSACKQKEEKKLRITQTVKENRNLRPTTFDDYYGTA